MDTQIEGNSKNMTVLNKLPEIAKFLKELGLPVAILAAVCVMIFMLFQGSDTERKMMQSKVDKSNTEFVNFLKTQHKEMYEAQIEQNILSRTQIELLRDLNSELKNR